MASGSSQQPQEHGPNKVQVTILASEWGSSKGGLSTINRELAIQLAKFPEVQITYFLPKCSEEDRKVALSHGINILEAKRLPGYEELEWLSFPPEHLRIDVIVGHGVEVGRQAQVIRNSHKCKWIQMIHTDPEELGMFKCYENPISKGEEKHNVEIELCEMSTFVVAVGPKLAEAFRKYLRCCKKDQDVFDFTPGIFDEFVSVQQVPEERKHCSVLVFGRGDADDFELKGFDIAARSVAALPDTHLVFVGAPDGNHEEIANRLLEYGIPKNRLRVRGYVKTREALKRLFCEVDLVLMPSRTEGFGLTGLEALSAGLPVIVGKNSGFGEALGNVPFGSSFVIDSEDPNAWTAAIKDIWNKNRQTRLDEAKVLRDSYGTKYIWSEQCNDLLKKMINSVNDASCEPQMPSEAQGKLQRKFNKDQNDISFTDHGLSQKNAKGEEKDFMQHSDPVHPEASCADVLSAAVGSSTHSQHDRELPHSANIIERVRQLYSTREKSIFPVPWLDDFSFHLDDIFTKLKILGKEKTRGTLTDEITNITAIFRGHKECAKPRTVLIEGDPGMGKTTYCQKLAYDWAMKREEWDKSFPKIDVLLLLRWRDIKTDIWEAIDDQILPLDIDEEDKEGFFKFIRENQSKVLLVLDGLDEVDSSKVDMCKDLLESKMLPNCHIVITSRHETGKSVRRYCDTLWEIIGFTFKDAKSYILKYFRGMEHLAKGLLKQLALDMKKEGDLKQLTQNPLNTALLCILIEDFKGVLPPERTLLYTEIVRCVLLRYEKRNRSSRGSDADLLEIYKDDLVQLGCMAWQSLRKGELFFDENEFKGTSSNLIKFGFLSIQTGGSKRKPSLRFCFLHKTFQEFFAGFYLAYQILDGDADCKSVVTDVRNMNELKQLLLFMSGILSARSEEMTVSLVKHIAELANSSIYNRRILELALDCILECKCHEENLQSKLLQTLGQNFVVQYLAIYIKFDHVSLLCEFLKANTFLTALNLRGSKIGFTGAESLSEALKVNKSLTTLDLRDNEIGSAGAESLSEALKVNTCLTTLNLGCNGIGATGAKSLSEALKVNTCLATLDLGWNRMGATGAESLSEALKLNTCLTALDLGDNQIGSAGAEFLSEALKVNTCLTTLNLTWNRMGATCAESLSEALKVNTCLTTLDLGWNRMGAAGAKSLSEALKVNTRLAILDLGKNEIGSTGSESLSGAIDVTHA
ncbi:protein NLRC3-like [Montipora capricornis]|uniref:protein NLRC3-like n=1 Tax=Montipora capricornis TaxID=246305 RepID=UPI0035F14991